MDHFPQQTVSSPKGIPDSRIRPCPPHASHHPIDAWMLNMDVYTLKVEWMDKYVKYKT